MISSKPTISPTNFQQAIDQTHSVFLLSQPAWINFQNIYKSLELMPTSKGYFADPRLQAPFAAVNDEGQDFEHNFSKVIDLANDFVNYGENMIGHLNSLQQVKKLINSTDEKQKQFGEATLEATVKNIQDAINTQLHNIAQVNAWISILLSKNASNLPQIQQLKSQFDQALASDHQALKNYQDEWLKQRKEFLDANEEFAAAWSATLKASFFGAVDTGILVGEIAAEDVSSETVKKVFEDGYEWIKDVVDLFSAFTKSQEAIHQIQVISAEIMKEIQKEGEDKLAALFLGMAAQNLERVPKAIDDALSTMHSYQSVWLSHKDFWDRSVTAIAQLSEQEINKTINEWQNLIHLATSFAEGAKVQYIPMKN